MHLEKPHTKQYVVVLLGTSVLMESVANSLSRERNLDVIHIDCSPTEITDSFDIRKPDMIIFELDHQQSYPMLSLVKDHADVLFLGIDLTSCQVIVLNTHLRLTRTMDELYKIVMDELEI